MTSSLLQNTSDVQPEAASTHPAGSALVVGPTTGPSVQHCWQEADRGPAGAGWNWPR
jgi:hypothetical protein